MSDLISREDTIADLHTADIPDEWMAWIEHFVNVQPSVDSERKSGKWIPCSERMPEPYVEVLATTTWGDVTMAMYHPDDTWSIHEGNTNATNEDILAWMPKPKGYNGGEKE